MLVVNPSAVLNAAAPLAQEYAVCFVFHNPDPAYYVEGPRLVRLEDGRLIAVVPARKSKAMRTGRSNNPPHPGDQSHRSAGDAGAHV